MAHNDYHLLTAENSAPIKMWTRGVPVEPEARVQLLNTAKMPFTGIGVLVYTAMERRGADP